MYWSIESFTFPFPFALIFYHVTKRYRHSGEAQNIQRSMDPTLIKCTSEQKIREGPGVLGSRLFGDLEMRANIYPHTHHIPIHRPQSQLA